MNIINKMIDDYLHLIKLKEETKMQIDKNLIKIFSITLLEPLFDKEFLKKNQKHLNL